MRLAKHLSHFRKEFNKFNNTRARINVRFFLSYDIKITLKYFWHKRVILASLCSSVIMDVIIHNVSRKSVNQKWFIDFLAWGYVTPRLDVI